MTKLKRCPFCGEEVVLHGSEDIDGKSTPYWYVKCECCGASVWGSNDKEKAIAAWNRRVKENEV